MVMEEGRERGIKHVNCFCTISCITCIVSICYTKISGNVALCFGDVRALVSRYVLEMEELQEY